MELLVTLLGQQKNTFTFTASRSWGDSFCVHCVYVNKTTNSDETVGPLLHNQFKWSRLNAVTFIQHSMYFQHKKRPLVIIWLSSPFFLSRIIFILRDSLRDNIMNSMKIVITLHFHEKWLQTMLWYHNARVNSHQRWKQTRFRVCFHLWCQLTSTMNVTEWQVSWNSWLVLLFFFFYIPFLLYGSTFVFAQVHPTQRWTAHIWHRVKQLSNTSPNVSSPVAEIKPGTHLSEKKEMLVQCQK